MGGAYSAVSACFDLVPVDHGTVMAASMHGLWKKLSGGRWVVRREKKMLRGAFFWKEAVNSIHRVFF